MLKELNEVTDKTVTGDIAHCVAYNRADRQKFLDALVEAYLDNHGPPELLFSPDKEVCQISVSHAITLVAENNGLKVDEQQIFETRADEKFTLKTLEAINQQMMNDAYVQDPAQVLMLKNSAKNI
jgi:hypothetical protein